MQDRLMLTLPNSGSTWLAALIARHLPDCVYYDKEFFNAVCNAKHEPILRRNFGSELVSCYRNIALPGDVNIHDDITRTWGVEPYTFTKECQSAFKLPVFVERFDCFVLLRSAAETFPPRRVRVWSFYEHAWHALRDAGHQLLGVTMVERGIEAHGILEQQIRTDAARLDVPVLEYDQLFGNENAVRANLDRVLDGAATDSMVAAVVATRERFARADRPAASHREPPIGERLRPHTDRAASVAG